jgi:hypothetical protein
VSAQARRFRATTYPETYERNFRRPRLVEPGRAVDPPTWWTRAPEEEREVTALLEGHPERASAAARFRSLVRAWLEGTAPANVEVLGFQLYAVVELVRDLALRAANGSGEDVLRALHDGSAVLASALPPPEPRRAGWVECEPVTEWTLLPADERAIHRLKLADRPWRCLLWLLASALRVTDPDNRPDGAAIVRAALRVAPVGLWPPGALDALPALIDEARLTLSRGGGRAYSIDAAVASWRRMFGEVPLPEHVFQIVAANPGTYGSVKKIAKVLRKNETEVARAIESLGDRVARRHGRKWWPAA